MVRLQITSDRNDIIPVIQDSIAAKMKRTEIGFRRTEQEIQIEGSSLSLYGASDYPQCMREGCRL